MTTLPLEVSKQYTALSNQLRAQEQRLAQCLTNEASEHEAYKKALKSNPALEPSIEFNEVTKALMMAKAAIDVLEGQIAALENKTIGGAVIAKRSEGKRGIMVVFHFDDNGKKCSVTRHLSKKGGKVTGQSIFNRGFVEYPIQL